MQTSHLDLPLKRGAQAPADVTAAVQAASAKTGVNFAYLMQKAGVESGYDATAKASTSSATGLFQFTEQTWLRMVADHGAADGYGKYANAISEAPDGKLYITDPKLRQEVMDLRNDPRASALMAAEYARDNADDLQAAVGGKVGATELYLAHFLGSGGASQFLNAMKANPQAPAASVLPQAAAANRSVFYNSETGQPKTLKEVYDRFAAKFDNSTTGSFQSAVASSTNSDVLANRFGRSPEALTDIAVPGTGGKTLSLYTLLTLASLNVPTNDQESGQRKKDDPLLGGRTFVTAA
ncbi:hypothetical protein [Roseiterribacter gracilis]|uniref:Transglycosylase SLT domain-containing protein n=1 Tax=Roseiterribacter gracilis TaxID=2812848 RepID=A0A8S8XH22_9PROT|nr:hypothetical protein TMPK1_34160 [Rhodospirillales bacterium TMPK1]